MTPRYSTVKKENLDTDIQDVETADMVSENETFVAEDDDTDGKSESVSVAEQEVEAISLAQSIEKELYSGHRIQNNELYRSTNRETRNDDHSRDMGQFTKQNSYMPAENDGTSEEKPLAYELIKNASIVASLLWVATAIFLTFSTMGAAALAALLPAEIGLLIAGILAPVAVLWFGSGSILRSMDNEFYTRKFRDDVKSLINPSAANEQRLKNGLEMLCQQASELGNATKASLESIHHARAGLRDEMEYFNSMSKQAESNVLRLTKTMQDRIVKLDEITKIIYNRTNVIGEKAGETTAALDKASQNLMQKVDNIEEEMSKGAEKVLSASYAAQDKIDNVRKILASSTDNLSETGDEVADRLEEIMERLSGTRTAFAGSVDDIEAERNRVADMLEDYLSKLDDALGRVSGTVNDSAIVIDAKAEHLMHTSDAVIKASRQIEDSIGKGADRLELTSDKVESLAESVDSRIHSQVDRIDEMLQRLGEKSDHFSDIGKSASRQLSEAMASALSGADAVSNSIRKSSDLLKNSSDEAVEQSIRLVENVSGRVREMNAASGSIASQLVKFAAVFDKGREVLDRAVDNAGVKSSEIAELFENHTDQLTLSYKSLIDRVENLKKSFDRPLKVLETAVDQVDLKTQKIDETLNTRIIELKEASDKAVEQASAIRQSLKSQSQEIATLSGHVSSTARTVNEQLEIQRQGLAQQVIETLNDIKRVEDSLQGQVANLHAASHRATDKIMDLEGKISSRYDEITSGAKMAEDRLDQFDKHLSEQGKSIRGVTQASLEDIAKVVHDLAGVSDEIATVADLVLKKTDMAKDSFVSVRGEVLDHAEIAADRLKDVAILYDDRLSKMKFETEEVTSVIDSAAVLLRDRLQEVDEVSLSASKRVRDVGNSLESQAANIHLVTDQAALRVETVQKAIAEQFHDFSETIGGAVAQLRDAGTEFLKCAEDINMSAEQIQTKISSVGKGARHEIQNMSTIAENTALLTTKSVQRVKDETERLVMQVEKSLSVLDEAGEGYHGRSNEINEQMQLTVKNAEKYSEMVREQISALVSSSDESREDLDRVVKKLLTQAEEIGKVAQNVTRLVDTSATGIAGQSTTLREIVGEVTKQSNEAADIFMKQSTLLSKASKEAMEQARKIEQSDFNARKEAFFNSAKFLIESMHSLSVDFTRLLEGEVNEKNWKAFQKGDVAVFTRRLLMLKDELPTDKIRKKYTDDTEFRNYVQRYFRLFEECFEHAQEADHGDLLTSVFASSDIGKLYYFLCSVLGREPRGMDKRVIH